MGQLDDMLAQKPPAAPKAKAAGGGGQLDAMLAQSPAGASGKPTSQLDQLGTQRPPPALNLSSLWSDVNEAGARNIHQMGAGLKGAISGDTVLEKGIGALEFLGGAVSYPLSPIEGLITHQLGRPIERLTGYPKEDVGALGSGAVQMAFDPLAGATKLSRAAKVSGVGTVIEGALSPSTVSKGSQLTAMLIRTYNGKAAASFARASNDLEQFRGALNRLPEAERFNFMHAIERGTPQSIKELQPAANMIRKTLDTWEKRVQSLGQGHLENAIENYFPHIWKDPKKAQTVMESLREEYAAAQSKRPIQGSGDFLKKRLIETIAEGRRRGLELVSTDPLELTLLKVREVQKFYYGTHMANALKRSRIARFVPYWKKRLPGEVELDDKVFRATLKPAEVVFEALHQTAYDPGIRSGLDRVSKFMGFAIKTPLAGQDEHLGSAFGYTSARPGADVVSRFGNELQVMEHEVGHQIDVTHQLWQRFSQNDKAWKELGDLALRRVGNLSPSQIAEASRFLTKAYAYMEPNKSYVGYMLSGMERMANFFHAYWYAPDLVREVAPTMMKEFGKWMDEVAAKQVVNGQNLKDVISGVKPTVRVIGEQQMEVFKQKVPGIRKMGSWVAPSDAARVFNNYVSAGIAGKNPLFDMVRHAENALNSLQLGVSFFHATFTSLDTVNSKMSLALEQVMRGQFGDAALSAIGAPLAPVTTAMRGARLRNAYLNPGNTTADMRKMVEALEKAGGRINMDQFYRVVEGHGLIRALKDGSFIRGVTDSFKSNPALAVIKLPFDIAMRAIQDIAHPVLEFLVPRQKLGVFYDMAKDWIDHNPNASSLELSQAMQLAWDSVDNRLGQMVYDNVFWNKAGKDMAFLTVRSVGWNLGTIRELGGGFMDLGQAMSALGSGDKVEMTRRMAYTITMPLMTALYGAITYYLYNGEGPKELKDYFFPKTGGLTPHGKPERISIPSYMKDVLQYNRAPLQTLQNKMNPLFGVLAEMTSNRDFYGGAIHDPRDPVDAQLKEIGEYLGEIMLPFSLRSYRRQEAEGASWGSLLASMLGFQAAPAFITDPERGETFEQRDLNRAVRRRAREQ